jgi:hypothetical protein
MMIETEKTDTKGVVLDPMDERNLAALRRLGG